MDKMMQKENLYKLDKILKEIDFIFKQIKGELMQTLKNEIKQKAIFMSLINIKETIKISKIVQMLKLW